MLTSYHHYITISYHQLPSVPPVASPVAAFGEATPLGLEAVVSEAFGIHPQCAHLKNIPNSVANWMKKYQSQCVCHCMSLSISFSMNFQIFQMHIWFIWFQDVSRRFRLLEVLSRQIGPFIHRRPLLCHASGPHASDLSRADLKGLGACLVREAPRLPTLPRLLTSMSQQEATTFSPNSAR